MAEVLRRKLRGSGAAAQALRAQEVPAAWLPPRGLSQLQMKTVEVVA